MLEGEVKKNKFVSDTKWPSMKSNLWFVNDNDNLYDAAYEKSTVNFYILISTNIHIEILQKIELSDF